MGLSDDEDNEVPADWDKSSNASSSSSSSASSNKSNKSKSSRNSKTTNDPNANAVPKITALGENQDVPQPPSAVHPEIGPEENPELGTEISIADGLSSPPPPGTVVAARPIHPLPRAPVAMNAMAIPRAPNLMMNPQMPPGMMMPRPMNPMMMMPQMMMMPRPPTMVPGMAQQPPMMPSAPTLCSMAATNMAAANNHMEINQMGAPVLRLSTQLEQSPSAVSRNNEYETTPANNVTPAMRAQVEMIRLAAKQTSEPVVDPLIRRKSFREKLVKLYSKVNPKRLEDIDDLLDKYAGREDKLLMGVLDKYECAAVKKEKKEKTRDCDFRAGGDSSKVVRIIDDDTSEQKSPKKRKIVAKRLPSPKKIMTSQEKIRDFYRTRIKKIYKERNPKKLSGLDTLLDKYKGKERDVWLSICDKYSVRPE